MPRRKCTLDILIINYSGGRIKPALPEVSVDRADTGSGSSFEHIMRAKRRTVAFTSFGSDLVATDTNGAFSLDVFVRHFKTGTTAWKLTTSFMWMCTRRIGKVAGWRTMFGSVCPQ